MRVQSHHIVAAVGAILGSGGLYLMVPALLAPSAKSVLLAEARKGFIECTRLELPGFSISEDKNGAGVITVSDSFPYLDSGKLRGGFMVFHTGFAMPAQGHTPFATPKYEHKTPLELNFPPDLRTKIETTALKAEPGEAEIEGVRTRLVTCVVEGQKRSAQLRAKM